MPVSSETKIIPHCSFAYLFEKIGALVELGAVERFVARDKLVVSTSDDAELPISYLSNKLQRNFLDLIEQGVSAVALQQHRLKGCATSAPILAAHGDHDLTKITKARVAFAHAFTFLKTADHSQWYLFYIANAKGTVLIVYAGWNDNGWCFNDYSILDSNKWNTDDVVVSPQILTT